MHCTLQVGENMGPDAAGMRVKLIDTVGLEDAESGDAVNLQVSKEALYRVHVGFQHFTNEPKHLLLFAHNLYKL